MPKFKLLIVDDHILFREGLVSLLKSYPEIEVIAQAGNVQEAIELSSQAKPDIILMDFNLPDGNGVEATQAIMANLPGVKVVFLTVHESDEVLFSAIRAGAKGFLLKNSPASKLVIDLQSVAQGEIAFSGAMTARIIDEFARTHSANQKPSNLIAQLSPREIEILKLLMSYITNDKIADRLFISENTVKHHVHRILQKLGAKNRLEAAEIARQQGLR